MLYPYISDLPFTEESRKRPVHIITTSKVMPMSWKTFNPKEFTYWLTSVQRTQSILCLLVQY